MEENKKRKKVLDGIIASVRVAKEGLLKGRHWRET